MGTTDPDLAALTRARPDALDPAQLSGSRRQHDDLVAILSTEREAAPAARPARRLRRLAIPAAGAAVVTAGVVAVVATLTGPATVGAAAHPAAPHQAQDARVVLLNMAGAIEHETGSGAYWEQRTTDGDLSIVAGAQPYTVADTGRTVWSIGVRPGEQSVWTSQIGEQHLPRTAADTARWQAAGSPHTVQVDPGLRKQGQNVRLTMQIGPWHEISSRTDANGDIVSVGPNNVNYAYLQKLPGNVAGLSALLDKLYAQDGGGENAGNRTEWMLTQATGLIQLPVSGAVRAAAYRIVAGLPGIRSLGTVSDALGRQGVGIALPEYQQGDLGAARHEVVVDPKSDTLLADETVLTKPSALASAAGLTAGTPVHYQATTEIGWTNQQSRN
jgi:hypothetical protein